MTEERKHAILFAATLLCARKLIEIIDSDKPNFAEEYWVDKAVNKAAHIDFTRNVIHVRRAVWEGKTQSTKTRNAMRVIDVQPSLIAMLKDYLNGRTDGLVFPSKTGKPLRNNNVVRRRLHPLLSKLGIRLGGMHGWRHGRVSYLVENDVPVEVI